MKSFSILKTNVSLTTNVKIMVNSNYKLSLDSIDSNYNLASTKYKNFKFNNYSLYDELIPSFYKDTSSEIAYGIKSEDDMDMMSDNFKDQYDELYNYGARNIINNKEYEEEYEYFAPIYINKDKLPSDFIIFRVDDFSNVGLTKENIHDNVIRRFKTVKVFDLSPQSYLGEWLDINFTNNDNFPDSPIEVYFEKNKFSKWNGIDFSSGGYTSKSIFLEDILEEEKEIFELEKFVTEGYKKTKVLFPNILNLSFLFDDTPSTPDTKRKWSLNQYYGFYLNSKDLSGTISPYKPPSLRNDIYVLANNILYSPSNENPFDEKWTEDKPFYVEYNGEYYLVNKFFEERGDDILEVDQKEYIEEEYQILSVAKYKIVSDVDLDGLYYSSFNQNYGYINEENNLMVDENTPFEISDFDKADVWVIKIDDIYHNLFLDVYGNLKINTDYDFAFNNNYFDYRKNGISTRVSFYPTFDKKPEKFEIFKLNFTDVKDFDNRIVDTEYSKYEYEYEKELTLTDESKMYFENINSLSMPKDLHDLVYKDEVVNIPVSSEYTANYETFKVDNGKLSDIWRINPVYCRWGFQNSLSSNDYPYLLNNSFIFEGHNRTTNTFEPNPGRYERNLDYFYTINSSSDSYIHHTLHIEDFDNEPEFNIDEYLNNTNYDYFTSFFQRKAKFNKGEIIKNVKKYSYFNKGDKSVPNISLFRGIEFRLYDVESISKDGDLNINVKNNNSYDDYKLSVLLTQGDSDIDWTIIGNWEMSKEYESNDIVLFDDILYKSVLSTSQKSPVTNNNSKAAPYNLTDWSIYDNDTFWIPNNSYGVNDIVYNNSEYYEFLGGDDDFWNPTITYGTGSVVLYKGEYYQSMTESNSVVPNTDVVKTKAREFIDITINYKKYWTATQSNDPKWGLIELWNPGAQYDEDENVVHNNKIYKAGSEVYYGLEIGDEPGVVSLWVELPNIEPETDKELPSDKIIKMNNRYYLVNSNNNNETLENGINIYINKKWGNVLINIYVNDNTLPNLTNTDRDDLYTDLYHKLTANNFINSINDLSNKYNFSDYLNYIIVDENNIKSEHNFNNLESLTSVIVCEKPDDISVKQFSLDKNKIDIRLKPNNLLYKGKITDISKLNWYSDDVAVGYSIKENHKKHRDVKNYNGFIDMRDINLYRYSGYYMPVFYELDIFSKDYTNSLPKNYLFDSELTNFGLAKERKMKKINRKGTNLRFKNSKEENSIYPMIDEFGYTTEDFMIFTPTWDKNYHFESVLNKPRYIMKKENKINDSRIGRPVTVTKKYTL